MMANEIDMKEILLRLKVGSVLEKRKANGKRFSRRFFLDEHERFISYDDSRKTWGRSRIYQIKDLNEVRTGFRAHTFGHLLRQGSISSKDEDRAFTIMYSNHRKDVHLMAPDQFTRDLWTRGIQYLIDRHAGKSQRHLIQEENWILNYFRLADKDGSNTLTKRECRRLLTDSLNVKVPDAIFEQLFQKADKSREGLLSPEEFLSFFRFLTQRTDLYLIMQKYTRHNSQQSMDKIHMTREDLLYFLQKVQRQTTLRMTIHDALEDKIHHECVNRIEQVQEFIDEFEMDEQLREKGCLSLDGFRNMLLSQDFDIVNPLHSQQIYQDMTRPLCDYYINTSHNTYLFYSQLSGESNPEAYNRVLLAGCRAVELDCYDGHDGQPIVTHAYTLVKPCSFESIIRYMEPNLFKTSPYPVILNIENHCSLEQQKEMARILKSILRDRLITQSFLHKHSNVLPSPEELKYKVLVRSRKNAKTTKPHTMIQLEDDDDSIFDPLSKNIQADLAELFIYLQNVPYRDYEYAKQHYSPFHSSSLAETRFEKLKRDEPLSIVYQTRWRLIRMYPGGLRQDSSNPNPVYAWNHGIQMVALNYQNQDDMMPLCYGKFLDNGGCGYVLKPSYLIHAQQSHYHPTNLNRRLDHPQILTMTIISSQFLARANAKTSDIPDPYVLVSIHGLPCDEGMYRTKVIENNGFNPIWNERCSFHIRYPRMALIYFGIFDHDSFTRDDKLAQFCLPLTMIQTGYRHIHLRAKNNDAIHSTLFVHVDLQNDSDEILCTSL